MKDDFFSFGQREEEKKLKVELNLATCIVNNELYT